MKAHELNEWGMLVFKHKTNKNLFMQKSYRWQDVAHMIDESKGRLIIDSFTFSTYDLTNWEPMTPEEYDSVISNYSEIYKNNNMNLERVQINGEWYVKETLTTTTTNTSGEPTPPQEILLDLSSEIVHTRSATYEDNEIMLECVYSISDTPSKYDTPYIHFLDKKRHGLDGNKKEYWDNATWMWGVYENAYESIVEIPKEYVIRVRSFIEYLVDNNILRPYQP
jgi:hypothetical protein